MPALRSCLGSGDGREHRGYGLCPDP
jgi:hypothetical protein